MGNKNLKKGNKYLPLRRLRGEERGMSSLFCLYPFYNMITKEQISTLVEDKIEGTDMFIVHVSVSPNNHIKVSLDADAGMSIERCVEVSRHIEGNFDREEEDFTLNVSSPGIDEGISMPRQFKKNIGRDIKVLKTGEHKKTEGLLKKADEQGILIERKEKQRVEGRKKKEWVTLSFSIPYNEIEEAKIVVSFK